MKNIKLCLTACGLRFICKLRTLRVHATVWCSRILPFRSLPKGIARTGFTLTEIVIAVGIMGFALIPLMGIIWGGVRRTDISVTYENAAQISSSIMEFLLSDAVQFNDLDFSQADGDASGHVVTGYDNVILSVGRRSSGFRTPMNPFGVTGDINSWLGDYCEEAGNELCTNSYSLNRFFKVGRENYYTALYIGAYYPRSASTAKPTVMSYAYLQTPFIDYEKCMLSSSSSDCVDSGGMIGNPQRFYDTRILPSSYVRKDNCTLNFSPYYACDGGGNYIWSFDRQYIRQTSDALISLPMNNNTLPSYPGGGAMPVGEQAAQFANFAKIQLFITWGKTWLDTDANLRGVSSDGGTVLGAATRGGAKTLELVSFKARIDSDGS